MTHHGRDAVEKVAINHYLRSRGISAYIANAVVHKMAEDGLVEFGLTQGTGTKQRRTYKWVG
jgi:hypothetical protein